jgi:hypothetical protein
MYRCTATNNKAEKKLRAGFHDVLEWVEKGQE